MILFQRCNFALSPVLNSWKNITCINRQFRHVSQNQIYYNTKILNGYKLHVIEHQNRPVKYTSIDSTHVISSPNPMFDHLLESSQRDDSNKWSSIGFGEEIDIIEIEIPTLSGALRATVKKE